MEHNIDKIDLPKNSRNQELEALSKKAFEPLFDVERFILKSETIDNGIDYRCEIKKGGNVLGFGFNFQLKSAEDAVRNTDGSYSKSLETSNIEYLINNGLPAFYGFYVVDNKSFYYAYLNDFIHDLLNKNKEWQKQPNHTLRFSKLLDVDSVNAIYNIVLHKGITLRKINSNLAMRSVYLQSDKIIIDYHGEVNTDQEIRDFIEKYGITLVNNCRWNEVLALHNKASQGISKSSKYNLIIGLANYYLGHYYRALDFFKESKKLESTLDASLKYHLLFIDASTKLLLRLLTEDEFNEVINQIPINDIIKSHSKIETAVKILKNNLFANNEQRVPEFEDIINEVINSSVATEQVKIRARCEMLFYNFRLILQKYLVQICEINAMETISGADIPRRKYLLSQFVENFKTVDQATSQLFKEIVESGNKFSYFYLLSNIVKFKFEQYVNLENIYIVEPPVTRLLNGDNNCQLLIIDIDKAIEYFQDLGHLENRLFSQSINYEILHYLNDDGANEIMSEMENLVELLDVKDIKERLKFIKDGGTNHQMLQSLVANMNLKSEEIKSMEIALLQMDKLEESDDKDKYPYILQISLFPIGNFIIPKQKKDIFYEGLSIPEVLRNQLDWFFSEGILPVINTYVYPITKEGPLSGFLEYQGIDNYKNMHQIRKFFFENKFYKM